MPPTPPTYPAAYRFLQLIFLHGVTPITWSVVREAGLWPQGGEEPPDFDETAAAHHHLFGFNLFPHAALYLEEDGLIGGSTADATIRLLSDLGVPNPPAGVTADHVAVYLGALGFLCGAEADAVEDKRTQIAAQLRDRQQRLLQEGVSPWIWPFLTGVTLQKDTFFQQIGRLTADLLGEHIATPAAPRAPAPPKAAAADLLANDATTVRDIAQFLLTPIHSGWFLTHEALTEFGRALDVPRGFGGREQTLVNLLRTAGQYQQVPELLDLMTAHLTRWADQYAGLTGSHPAIAADVEFWEQRLAQTHLLIRKMRPLIISNSANP